MKNESLTRASCHRYTLHSWFVCKLWMYAFADCVSVRLVGLLQAIAADIGT